MKRLSLLVTALCFSLIGCEPAESPSAAAVQNPIVGMGTITYSYAPGPSLEGLTPEERAERAKRKMEVPQRLHEATDGLSLADWREADARLASAVATFEGREREIAQQHATSAMLRVWLPAADEAPEVRQSFAKHALLMAREGSPETEMIADAIEAAGDQMPPAFRIEAARLAVDAARARLERLADCEGPGCDGPPTSIVPDNAISERNAQALQRLDAILAASS